MAKGLTPEQLATQQVLLQASVRGCKLLRNNNGGFYDETGRFINFGLGNDGSKASKNMAFGDYVGIYELEITPEMVGKTVGVFTMIEVKPDGHLQKTLAKASKGGSSREAKQLKAINFVREHNGFAWFASNATDVDQIIDFHIYELMK